MYSSYKSANQALQRVKLTEDNKRLFAPVLTVHQKSLQCQLLDLFADIVGNRYSLAYGSLYGALLFKAMVPWDDDVDLFCNLVDFEAIREACIRSGKMKCFDLVNMAPVDVATEQGQQLWYQSGQIKKTMIHFDNEPPDRPWPWPWPYLEISWLQEISTTELMDTSNGRHYPKSDIYPLSQCSFEGKLHPCPINSVRVMQHNYADSLGWSPFEYAIPAAYNHMLGQPNDQYQPICLHLQDLSDMYPVLQETLPLYSAFKSTS